MISYTNFQYESKPKYSGNYDFPRQRQQYSHDITRTKSNDKCQSSYLLVSSTDSLPTNYSVILASSPHHHRHRNSWSNDRTSRLIHFNRSTNILSSGVSHVDYMGNRKFSDWQSVLKCRDPLTHVNFKDCNNALKWWSSSNLCHEQPPFSQQYSFWPQDSYYQNSNSNVFLENNSQQLKIPSMPASTVLKFGHPVKGPSVDGGSSKSNENLELQDVHTSKYTAIKHVPFIRRPPDPKLCLGSQWYAINNPVISLPESSSSENKKSVLWSVPSDCSTYLTESEIDSIVSKIAEEANSHNFTPIWMVNESCNEFDQKSVHSSKTIDNTEPDTKDKQQREILAVNSRFKHNRRKQAKPQCSAKKHDPEFQGVIIDIQIQREKNQCKLKLQSSYNLKMHNFQSRNCSRRSCCTVEKVKQRSSTIHSEKQCVSCNAEKASSWTDCDKGKLLCNACNSRFKKFGVRCRRCWHIPKTFMEPLSKCGSCGASLCFVVIKRSTINCNLPEK